MHAFKIDNEYTNLRLSTLTDLCTIDHKYTDRMGLLPLISIVFVFVFDFGYWNYTDKCMYKENDFFLPAIK